MILTQITPTTSTSPTGEEFPLPVEADYQAENNRLSALVAEHKKLGQEIVVVMGVGFVGAVMAGIGGYCLPKDGGLGVWSYHTLMGFEDDIFKITPMAIDINDTRALHVAGLVRDGLRNQSKIVAASRILVLGASYREDVGDTRYSGSEQIIAMVGNPAVIIDCFVMLTDIQIKTFFAAGYEVKGLGRGHMKRLKEEVAGVIS